jgi:hypothetical protein
MHSKNSGGGTGNFNLQLLDSPLNLNFLTNFTAPAVGKGLAQDHIIQKLILRPTAQR